MSIVEIETGKLRGKTGIDRLGASFYSFQNIPYAAPPIGNLRFKAPQPAKPWTGIKDATEEGNASVSRHIITKEMVGSEDCLNLNVYTPELPGDGHHFKPLKPVMFWIHGGVFMTGSNKTEFFGPEFLMPEDIVLVTINYRLGILGFLSLDDSSLGVPGNAGFKDMVMALKWVKRNIIKFSGDPNNVTVFGESAGAVAAHLLMLSPMTKGLLHKVIAQSGSALNSWVLGRRAARLFAKCLGFNSFNDKKILEFLQKVPAEKLLKIQIAMDHMDFVEDEIRCFGAVIERPSNEEPFLSEHPIDIILSGNYNHVPLIMGYNFREGMAIDATVPSKARKSYFQDMEISVPLVLNIQRGSALSKALAEKIRDFYFGVPEYNRKEHLQNYYDLSSDTVFFRDVYFSINHHMKTARCPLYFYRVTIETELNIFKKISGNSSIGVYHGDDLGYLFKTMFSPEIYPGSIEDLAQRRFTRLWANFARYGNPTPDINDQLLNVEWKPIENNKIHFLDIGKELTMKINPEPERMTFWKEIYKNNPAICKL